MKLTKELKAAIIVLAGILLFIVGFNYLKSNSLISSDKQFYAVYDHVGGLAVGTPVTINGLTVGKIKNVQFLNQSPKLIVTFTANTDLKFSRNSHAELFDTGIIGGKSIQILPVFDSNYAKSGDTLVSTVKPGLTELVTQGIGPLEEQLGKVMRNADSLLTNLNDIMDTNTKFSIQKSIAGLNTTIENFKKTSESIDDLIVKNQNKLDNTLVNVENITDNLSKVSDTLSNVNIGQTTRDLQVTIKNINKILAQIEKGEGSVGKLLNDEKLYDDLTGASEQLELLLEDLRLNPKRYVHFSLFGRKAKQYKKALEEEEKSEN